MTRTVRLLFAAGLLLCISGCEQGTRTAVACGVLQGLQSVAGQTPDDCD